MIALLDLGNTRFKAAVLVDDSLAGHTAARYDRRRLGEAIIAWLSAQNPVDRVLVSSVLGYEAETCLSRDCVDSGLPNPEFLVTPARGHGVTVGYPEPASLGVDRFLGLVAAWGDVTAPCIVIDCGTAITIDGLDADGLHRGGLILPGLELAGSSLTEGTAALPLATARSAEVSLFAQTTTAAIDVGLRLGLAGAIERICDDMAEQLGSSVARILTGGSAKMLLPLLRSDYQHDPHLVLRGMAMVARETECVS
jgi:type III pantothenate kinase